MARNIVVEPLSTKYIEKQDIEIVERKGIGHPDSIADGLAESVSRSLCKLYIKKYGHILHHNTDECQIVGGQSAPAFGGGVVLEPAQIILVGRATTEVDGVRLPYRSVALKAASESATRTRSWNSSSSELALAPWQTPRAHATSLSQTGLPTVPPSLRGFGKPLPISKPAFLTVRSLFLPRTTILKWKPFALCIRLTKDDNRVT